MAEYTGSAVAACWNGVSLPQVRSLRITNTGDIPKQDISHSGDASQQMIDDIPNAPQFSFVVSGFYEQGDTTTGSPSFAPLVTGSLDGYPEGAPAAGGKPWVYCHSMYLSARGKEHAFGAVNTYEFTFTPLASGSLTTNGVSASHA